MPSENSHFLVNPYHDPVVVKIVGKATFQNAAPLKDTFDRLLASGSNRFVLDFKECSGMDSTFLGILAGLAIKLRNRDGRGSVVLCRLGQRNHELVTNLGLHRILTMDNEGLDPEAAGKMTKITPSAAARTELDNARIVLEAHENLVSADSGNQMKFRDVIDFLKNQIDEA